MAESVRVQDLPEAIEILDSDLFVLSQGGVAKKMLGELLKRYISDLGGIESVEQNSDYTLTITFTNGSTFRTAPINVKGDPGERGFSPRVSLTPSAGGIVLTITDIDGPHEALLPNGEDTVTLTSQTNVTLSKNKTTVVLDSPSAVTVNFQIVGPGIGGEASDYIAGLNFKAGSDFVLTHNVPSGYAVQWDSEPNFTAGISYEIIYRCLWLTNSQNKTIISARYAEV